MWAVEGKNLIYVEELPVKDHYIFYCEKQVPAKTFGLGKLMGEGPRDPPPPAVSARRSRVQALGTQTPPGRPLGSGHSVLRAECRLQLGRGCRLGTVRDRADMVPGDLATQAGHCR